jgi:hypothetical protein
MLSLLCGLTGRSNFFFGRLFAAFSGASYGFIMLLWAGLDPAEESVIYICLDLVSLGVVFSAIRFAFQLANRLESSFEAGELHLNISELDMGGVRLLRLGLVLITLAAIPQEPVMAPFTITLAAAFYFLLDFRPKRKSMVRKLIEAVARKAGQIHLPAPVPNPTPT